MIASFARAPYNYDHATSELRGAIGWLRSISAANRRGQRQHDGYGNYADPTGQVETAQRRVAYWQGVVDAVHAEAPAMLLIIEQRLAGDSLDEATRIAMQAIVDRVTAATDDGH